MRTFCYICGLIVGWGIRIFSIALIIALAYKLITLIV